MNSLLYVSIHISEHAIYVCHMLCSASGCQYGQPLLSSHSLEPKVCGNSRCKTVAHDCPSFSHICTYSPTRSCGTCCPTGIGNPNIYLY